MFYSIRMLRDTLLVFGKQVLNVGLELLFEGEYDIPLESVVVFSLIVGSMILIAAKKKLLSDHFIVFGLEGLSLCVDV